MATVPRQVVEAAVRLVPAHRKQLLTGLACATTTGRVEWNDYVAVLERLQEAAGSSAELERLTEESYHAGYPQLTAAARQVISPAAFLKIADQIICKMFPTTSVVDKLDDQTWIWRLQLPRSLKGNLWLFRGNIAAARGSMNHLGLPPASVDAVFDEYGGDYLMRLPPSAALYSRMVDAAKSAVQGAMMFAGLEADSSPPPRFEKDVLDEVRRVGDALASCNRVADLLDVTLHEVKAVLGSDEVSIWKRPNNGARLEFLCGLGKSSFPATISAFSLTVAGDEFGRIECVGGKRSPLLQALVPWLSLALAHALSARTPSRRSLAECLEDAVRRWSLTTRQLAVLERAVQGLSNKEIAAELGLSVKTIELHMAQVFVRTGARSRSQLASLLFES